MRNTAATMSAWLRHVGEQVAPDVDPARLVCGALEGPPESGHET
jgi:hypothetical protein